MARVEECDVAVVGLGAMGSATLWALAKRGVRAVGVEQFEPGHARGSSHGESRIIRTAYFEGPGYVPLVRRSWELWRELEKATGTALLTRTGAANIGPPGGELVTGAAAAAAEHGLPVERLAGADLAARLPAHRLGDTAAAVLEEQAGVLRPEAAVRAAAEAATAAGATVLAGAPVVEVVPDPGRPVVRTAETELRAGHVVVTAGAWLDRLVPPLRDRVRVLRRVMGWFPVADPAAYAPDRFPVFIRDDGDGPIWYGFPTMDGRTVKIAEHMGEGLAESADPAAGPRPPDARDAERLAGLAVRLRGLAAEPERMTACMYTMTADEHFLVGRRDDLPGVTILGGFSGHGFKFATTLGEVAADLALTGRTDAPIGLFDPCRFG